MSSMDEIRAKRLEKLKKPKPTPSPPNTDVGPTKSTPDPIPATLRTTPVPKSNTLPSKESHEFLPAPKQPSKVSTPEVEALPSKDSFPRWAAQQIRQIFDISETPGKALIHLDISLKDASLDDIFVGVLETGAPGLIRFEYFYKVYEAATKELKYVPKNDVLQTEKLKFINDIISNCYSYATMSLDPEGLFDSSDLVQTVKYVVSHQASVPFLTEMIRQIDDEEVLYGITNSFFSTLATQLYRVNLDDLSYGNYLSIFESLLSVKKVAAIFHTFEDFHPFGNADFQNALEYEQLTILGSLLRLSPLQGSVAVYYYGDRPKDLPMAKRISIADSVRNEYNVVIERLYFIVRKLFTSSPTSRTAMLRWFARVVNGSHLRRGTHAQENKIVSDGFMFNCSIILIKLCSGFWDYPNFNSIGDLAPEYFLKSDLIDVSEEPRFNSSLSEAQKLQQETPNVEMNFISDCFFLSLAYLQYGIGGIQVRLEVINSQLKNLEEYSNRGPLPPNFIAMQNILLSKTYVIENVFTIAPLQQQIFDFIIGAITYMTRVIDSNHQYPKQKLDLPLFKIEKVSELDDREFLSTKAPSPWKYFPEFILESIINYCKLTLSFRSTPLLTNDDQLSLFIEFAITLLRCPELINNPHLKSSLMELLFQANGNGKISSVLINNKNIRKHVLYSLLDFYVMVEKTGSSSQFYDKLKYRYYVADILENIWQDEFFRKQLKYFSTKSIDFFVRFISRMLNDTTYLLDESLNSLNKIHLYQEESKKRAQGLDPDTEEYGTDKELQDNLSREQKSATSLIQLCNKTLQLFNLFAKETPNGFVLTEIVDRVASMLDYNLTAMVGPKSSQLKVENPQAYNFDPKQILLSLVNIYCILSNEPTFVTAVARDARSFNIQVFVKAEKILSTRTFIEHDKLKIFREFAEKAESQRLADENEELELGEIPDEFLDPLMYTLMEDPVILPSSKVSIDRSTIKAHLLSDPIDPFNRMPLKIEDVVPDEELKRKIQEFKNSKKRV